MQEINDPTELKDIWRHGFSLVNARERFSSPKIDEQERQKLVELGENPNKILEGMSPLYQKSKSPVLEAIRDITISMQPIATFKLGFQNLHYMHQNQSTERSKIFWKSVKFIMTAGRSRGGIKAKRPVQLSVLINSPRR